MFSACLSEEAIELLVAHLFVKPLPFTAPCSRITGFLRLKLVLVQTCCLTINQLCQLKKEFAVCFL